MAFYSRRHYREVGGFYAKDTPEATEERKRHREACEQAVREREAKFPVLTPDNVAEAIAWQEARIQELLKED